MNINNDERILKYFIPPPIVTNIIEYQDINKDKKLRTDVTNFFLKKSIKWIDHYKEFNNLKNKITLLKSEKGYKIIYNLLRKFIKRGNNKWFDLRSNYEIIKDYLKYELGRL